MTKGVFGFGKRYRLYTHKNWGGIFEISDDGVLQRIVQEPTPPGEMGTVWRLVKQHSFHVGQNILYGDEDLSVHYIEFGEHGVKE